MSTWKKALLLQLFFLTCFPLLGWALIAAFKIPGIVLLVFIFAFWCWQLFAYLHYRHCRQEEFLFVLQTAATTQAPIEALLRAYVEDRPREHVYRGALLFFVFPGYYWIHLQRSFDVRLTRLAAMLESGIPLSQALHTVQGVVAPDVALAVTVGQFTGKLSEAMQQLPERRLSTLWIEMGTRLLYPLLLLLVMFGILSFVMIFVIPKFEKMFSDFKMRLPEVTEILIQISRVFVDNGWLVPFLLLDLLIAFNFLLFNSSLRWYCPLIGHLYQMNKRGQFLQTLGLMLQTRQPLPAILDRVLDSELLPAVVHTRVSLLAEDLREGVPLVDGLARRGLVPSHMKALIASAEKANNLPWALQELGDSLARRSARLIERTTMIAFPITVAVCAALIGFVAYAIFHPLATLLENIHG